MANVSTYIADKLLDHLFDTTPYTPVPLYVALFTTTPAMPSGSGGVEVSSSGTGYLRLEATGHVSPASGNTVATNADLVWNQATSNWGTITGAALMDASAVGSGNVILGGPLSIPKTVNTGVTFSIPGGQIIWTFS